MVTSTPKIQDIDPAEFFEPWGDAADDPMADWLDAGAAKTAAGMLDLIRQIEATADQPLSRGIAKEYRAEMAAMVARCQAELPALKQRYRDFIASNACRRIKTEPLDG